MMIARSAVVAIALITLMIAVILLAMMLLIAQFTTTCGRKISRFLLIWLLFIFGNLLENASCLVGCLTLLKESDELEQVSRHRLVQVHD
jgi:hypothetical protein